MEDVAAREAVLPLHVERRSPPHRNHRAADVRGVTFEDVKDPVREGLRLGLPRTAPQVEGSELRGYGERVLTRRSNGLIVRRLEDEFEEGFAGRFAAPRVVIRVFEVVDGRGDVDYRLMMRLDGLAGDRLEIRQLSEREVQFEGGRLESNSGDRARKIGRKMVGPDEAQERPLGILVTHDDTTIDRRVVFEHHSYRTAVSNHDPRDRSGRPDLRSEVTGGPRHRFR